MGMSVCEYVYQVGSCTYKGQKRMSDALQLELWAIVSHLPWILRIKLRVSVRAASGLTESSPATTKAFLMSLVYVKNWIYQLVTHI